MVEKKRLSEVIYNCSDSVSSVLMHETAYCIQTLLTNNEMLFLAFNLRDMHLVCGIVE